MVTVETIGRIRRAFWVEHKPIRQPIVLAKPAIRVIPVACSNLIIAAGLVILAAAHGIAGLVIAWARLARWGAFW